MQSTSNGCIRTVNKSAAWVGLACLNYRETRQCPKKARSIGASGFSPLAAQWESEVFGGEMFEEIQTIELLVEIITLI